MRSPWLAINALLFLVLGATNAAGHVAADVGHRALVYRDEAPASSSMGGSTADATSSEPKPATATTSASSRKATETSAQSSSEDSPSTTADESSTAAAATTTTTNSLLPSSTLEANSTSYNATMNGTQAAPGELPLQPVITPALSVGGVLLILTGIVYCLIGIKNKWIQIFISAAYLTSLAILVLIVYVMKPPISNGIQGAYLAAIAVPALMLGGGALIFRDVTEGLGCAIGGFAISMFLLVLKPGGTITSQAGRAIFIGVFTAVAFALSFSRFTRSYGIIGSSALGGATAIILGVDCFSRAGMKEFWVYIWALNEDLFPLLQDTYPITRGMRVELAGIVVFTFFGVLSQLKIWKVIQARRERKEQEEIEANRERDELEAQIGQDVEAGNDRDRGQWEAIYGDKDKTPADSGVGTEAGSTRKGSYSTDSKYGKHSEIIELDNLDSPRTPTIPEHGDPMVIRVAADDYAPAPSVNSRGASIKEGTASIKEMASSVRSVDAQGNNEANIDARSEHSTKAILPQAPKPAKVAGPKVVPLPFKIPNNEKDDDEVASNATFNDSEHSFKRYSQRFSGLHLMRKPSERSKRASMLTTSSVEALVDPDGISESDRAAALSSRSNSLSGGRRSLSEASAKSGEKRSSIEGSTKGKTEQIPEQDFNFQITPLTMAALEGDKADAKSKKTGDDAEKVVDVKADEDAGNESDGTHEPPQSVKSKKSTKSATYKDLKSNLPGDTSKVVLQFRTNEWAKHLSNAEQPDFEEIPYVEPVVEETAPAVNPRALLQTALTAEPKPANLPKSSKSSKASSLKSPPTATHPGLPGRIPSLNLNGSSSPGLSPNGSVTSLHDNYNTNANPSASQSRTSLHSQPSAGRRAASALRSTSSPLMSTPIDEDAEADFHTPLPTDTLMAQRGALMQHKAMTGSFQNLPLAQHSSVHLGSGASPLSHKASAGSLTQSHPTSGGSANSAGSVEDGDDMSLSARRAALQRSSTAGSQRPSASPLMLPTAIYTSARDSPTPDLRRSTTDPALRRASMLAAWRQSIAADVHKARGTDVEVNARREEMYHEQQRGREREEAERRRAEAAKWGGSGRDSPRDSAQRLSKRVSRMSNMSGREMNDAHREVLRRMQAGANQKLKEKDQDR